MTSKNRQEPWVIRTDFSDDEKWTIVSDLLAAPQTVFGRSFRANVQFISNENYARLECNTPKQTTFIEIQTFRAKSSAIASIQVNLTLANMGFEEFAHAIDDDGLYRGFPR